MDDEFECAACHGTFLKDRSDAEAMKESIAVFGDIEEPEIVCEDCWQQMMALLGRPQEEKT